MNLKWCVNNEELIFEDWLIVNNDELNIMFAENGSDREMDFDFEDECSKIFDFEMDNRININNHSVQPMD